MCELFRLFLLVSICSCGYGANHTFELFIEDIIVTWKLISPTIVVDENLLQACRTLPWVLCLADDNDNNELVEHLGVMHQGRKHDGIIFANEGQKELLQQLNILAPKIFRSKYPIFMPIGYSKDLKLRLDSNIIFFEEKVPEQYSLVDIFAVKGGTPIELKLANWTTLNGFKFVRSHNRWERRTDLKGARFFNIFGVHRLWANVTRDEKGNITGSNGYYQDVLFLVLKRLNLTIITMEPKETNINKLLGNGTWSGVIGALQRKEADIGSSGLGLTSERAAYVDYTIKTQVRPTPITLLAHIPKGSDLNMWVYLQVFGLLQWIIFLSFIISFVIIITTMYILDKNRKEESKLKIMGSALATAYLYTLQLGDHPKLKGLKSKLMLMTMSWMTLLMFICYSSEITAQMTSGPAKIPVRRFEDVIRHGYKVVSASNYYVNTLATASPDSAKHQAYKLHFETGSGLKVAKDGIKVAIAETISDPKTLMLATELSLARFEKIEEKHLAYQLYALRMDDASYVWGGFALQKDSEFLGLFNFYLLKAIEHGTIKRLFQRYHIDLYVKEQFGMVEPQPLTYKNVMFTFIFLGTGIFAAIVIAMLEYITKIARSSGKNHILQQQNISKRRMQLRGKSFNFPSVKEE